MSSSIAPYMIRAYYAWMVDNGLSPHVVVRDDEPGIHAVQEYIHDHKIVLNVSPEAVRQLNITNTYLEFDARFSGAIRHVYAAIENVLAIYASETGEGGFFDTGEEGQGEPPPEPKRKKMPKQPKRPSKPGKPDLKIVK